MSRGQSNDGTEPDDFGTLPRSWMHGMLIEKTDSKFFTASVVPCIEAQQPQGLHLAAKFSVPIG
jgi:hypothetical protein